MSFLLGVNISAFGQWGEIIKIQQNGTTLSALEILITTQRGEEKRIRINTKTESQNASRIESGTIIILDPNTSIGLKSANGNEVYLTSQNNNKILEYLVTSYREVYRSLDENESGNILTKVFKPITGNVTTSNINRTINGAADGTEWVITNGNSNLNFKINEGKVTVKGQSKIEMDDDILNLDGEEHKRILYLDQKLDKLKSGPESRSFSQDSLLKKPLSTDEEIDAFFISELANQKRVLRSRGPLSNKGFKNISNGEYNEGIEAYKLAIEEGELNTREFIQSSLIVTEAYHEIATKKTKTHSSYQSPNQNRNKDVWLEAALHFIKEIDSVNKIKFDSFKNNPHKSLVKAFGYDLVLSTQYQAWAYTVKLKITGCLEHSDQNPILLLEEAAKLNDSLKAF